ncbi:MAG: hypothetical protein LKM45_06865 [Wolbachia endosymbiont of Alcedoecus sp.]|nr:hypothetical protein [Wolbachia endosymbiont of Alcedoecus sp.]
MEKFLPKIMAIGNDIKEVEEKVNEKVQKPPSKVDSPSSEQVGRGHKKSPKPIASKFQY